MEQSAATDPDPEVIARCRQERRDVTGTNAAVVTRDVRVEAELPAVRGVPEEAFGRTSKMGTVPRHREAHDAGCSNRVTGVAAAWIHGAGLDVDSLGATTETADPRPPRFVAGQHRGHVTVAQPVPACA